ncbi:hypothetical protein F5Y12DRAFT_793969 [Xylaria sp. FL1777]|nr:hypothetical protein F5Y12DRAFT_793969 [Xylaria sp. FL1777]
MPSMEGLVESTPPEDASVDEVRSWMLQIFHRRCHPDPKKALDGFYWKGRHLHSQRRYVVLRLRFRREPYGFMIAHDIHDAVKASRKRAHNREKEFRKSIRKGKKLNRKPTAESAPTSATQVHCPLQPHAQSRDRATRRDKRKKIKYEQTSNANVCRETDQLGRDEAQEVESSTINAKTKLVKTSATNTGTTSSRTIAAASSSPSDVKDSLRNPISEPKRTKTKEKKAKKKTRWKKAMASLESLGSTAAPLGDLEPMRLIDADEFRLESPEDTNCSGAPPFTPDLDSGKQDVKTGRRGKRARKGKRGSKANEN